MKISIIITSYNSEKFLKYSIQSVLDQSYKNFELIIVDDLTTDKSRKINKKFLKKYRKNKYFFLKKNSGTASIPRNKGAEIAKGDFICFLDADDIWHEDKLKIQLNFLKKNHLVSFTG